MRSDIATWRVPRLLMLAALCAACGGGDSPAEPAASALVLEAISPTMLEGTVGTAVADMPAVRVTDGRGTPVAGVEIRFQATAGSMDVAVAVTDARGIAAPGRWVLGTHSGEHRLIASRGAASVMFSATARAGAPTSLLPLVTTDLVAFTGDPLYVTLEIRDRFGNRVGDVDVVFEVTGGGGEVGGAARSVRRSGLEGLVQGAEWVLGARPGTNVLTARVADLEPVTFTALTVELSTVTWYELRAIRDDIRVWPVQPVEGRQPVRLALTPFDSCLCREQTGHVVQHGALGPGGLTFPVERSGTFRVAGSGAPLTLTWTSDYVAAGGTPLTSPALLRGDSLLVQLSEPETDYSELWIYVRGAAP